MKKIYSLLSLRLKQGFRYLHEIGFGLLAVALFVLTGGILMAIQSMLSIPAYGALVLLFIVLLVIEIKRNDLHFLKSIFDSKIELFAYKVVENLIIASPVLIFQAIFQRWDIVLYFIVICNLVSVGCFYFTRPNKNERKISLHKIPLSLYEVKFYFEKNILSILFIWLLLCLGSLHISLWILGMFFMVTLPLEIFKPLESSEMVRYEAKFVFRKIIKNVGFIIFSIAGPTIITSIFNPDTYFVLVYGVVAMALSTTFSICKKYANYYGVTEMVASTTSTAIIVFLMLAPGGILITLSACIYYYFRAETHMKEIYAST